MRLFLSGLFLLVFSLSGFSQKAAYDLKIKIGQPQKKVKKIYGHPFTTSDSMDVYTDQGFIVKYTPKHKIRELIFGYFVGGRFFSGELYGIGLGDTYPKCTRIWGEPVSEKAESEQYYQYVFRVKKYTLVVDFWNQPGSDPDFGGDYETDTVKRIRILSR